MAIIYPPNFIGADVDAICRNWNTDALATQRRMPNQGAAASTVADGINALTAYHPNYIFSKALPIAAVFSNESLDPVYQWKWNELFSLNPATAQYKVHLICLPPSNGNGGARVGVANSNSYYSGSVDRVVTNASESDVRYDYFTYSQTPENAYRVDGLKIENYARIVAVAVEERLPGYLSSQVHTVCFPEDTRLGAEIHHKPISKAVKQLHDLRSKRLGRAFSWCGIGQTATPADPGDEFCATVTNADYVNLFDRSITNRTEVTPGACIDVQYGGRGAEDEDYGKKVKVQCWVFAECSNNASNAYVKFTGPEHVENNDTEVLIPGADGLGWYGSTNYIYLNSNVAANSTDSTNFNKVDVMAKVVTNGDSVYVRAFYGQIEYE